MKNRNKWTETVEYVLTYPGWLMVLVGFVTIMAMAWPLMVYKFIYGPVIDEFGWSRTEATMLITWHWISAAITGFFIAGPLIDRIGLRRVILFAQLAMVLALTGFLFINSKPVYYFMGMIIGFSVSATMISVNVFVSRWFIRNQGLAIGITIIALSVAGAVIPLICEPLINLYGWRVTMALGSIFIVCVGIPVYQLLAREDPADEEIAPELVKSTDDAQMTRYMHEAEPVQSLSEILRSPMLWLIVTAIYLVTAVDQGLMQHTILYIERDLGLGSRMAAYAMSGMFALGIVAKLGGGWLYDKISIKGIMLVYCLLSVSVVMAIPIAGPMTVALFALIRGIAHGALIGQPPIYAKHCYGKRYLNRIMPVMLGAMYTGFATGPVLLSTFYDSYGNYFNGLLVFAMMALVAATLLIFVRPLYRERLQAKLAPA